MGESLSEERDFEAWCEEKAKWEAEVDKARQMEKESFERFEVRSRLTFVTHPALPYVSLTPIPCCFIVYK